MSIAGLTTQAYAYSPHLPGPIDPGIKGSKEDGWVSGRKIVYDIYSGVDGKPKWQIANRDYGYGSQPYLEFTGWSALLGWHHHNADNQKTYIWASNKNNGKSYMYLAEMNGLSASKDLEYNRQSPTGPIYKPCSEGTYNTSNEICNMYYDHVGFVAHIPLKELFPDGISEDVWELKIIKNVDGRVVWDDLKLPFHFDALPFGSGEIDLDSGLNAESLRMADPGVVRRNYPREGGWSGGKYFIPGKTYQRVLQNEENTVVWYGVISPHDGNETRWASGAYWIFDGKPARLTYRQNNKTCPDGSVVGVNERCIINVNIQHVDANTKKILREDQKKLNVGDSYQFKPEQKGVFTDSEGNPYVASPSGQMYEGTAAENNLSLKFTYKSSLPDPGKPGTDEGFTDGMAKGQFLWELRRVDPLKPSQVYIESDFSITGKHFEVRNISHQANVSGVFSEQDEGAISLLADTSSIQNRDISFNFSYEYTNYYNENYICTDEQDGECFEWVYKDTTPDWTKAERFDLSTLYGSEVNLLVDPSFGKMFQATNTSSLQTQQLTVGKKRMFDVSQNNTKPIFNKTYYEVFKQSASSEAKDSNPLATQSWIDLSPGTLEYQVELPTDSQTSSSFAFLRKHGAAGHYYPLDVDKSLKSIYSNKTPYAYSRYAFPLELESLTDQGIQNGKRQYRLDWTSDYFFLAEHTGFIEPFPYTKYVSEGKSLPAASDIKQYVESEAQKRYQEQTGQVFKDSFLHLDDDFKSKYLNRYYLPIESDSVLKPKQQYENKILLSDMGLNDASFVFGQTFSFDRYLVGSVLDDAFVVEQHDPTVPISSYPYEISINKEQQKAVNEATKKQLTHNKLFGFRKTDRTGLYDQLKDIINLGF
ncbi:hypothetical protein [Paenibacillus larvae]|nr:hypothetical protein [Paenibacillus larvae]MDR5608835.1 hypothetical protein [Paenibacillus larvae]